MKNQNLECKFIIYNEIGTHINQFIGYINFFRCYYYLRLVKNCTHNFAGLQAIYGQDLFYTEGAFVQSLNEKLKA